MRGLFRSHCWGDRKSQKRGPDCGMAIIQRSDSRIAPWRGQKIATDKLLIHGEGEGLMWRGTSYMTSGGGVREGIVAHYSCLYGRQLNLSSEHCAMHSV